MILEIVIAEHRSSGYIFTDSSGGLFSFTSPVSRLSAVAPAIFDSEQADSCFSYSAINSGSGSLVWDEGFLGSQGQEVSDSVLSRITAAGKMEGKPRNAHL